MIGAQTATLDARPMVEPMIGRQGRARQPCCFLCLAEIQPEEAWKRLAAPDDSYSVVVHTDCLDSGT
jgi:hypothetical protein